MPTSKEFWLPVHEAGHAIAAIKWCNNFRFSLINVKTGFGYTETYVDPAARAHSHSDISSGNNYMGLILAGMAAEMMINDLETRFEEDVMIPAMLERGQNDRILAAQGLDLPKALAANKTNSKDILFIKLAYMNIIPKLEKEMNLFNLIRKHLIKYSFIGNRSLHLILRSETMNDVDLRADYDDVMSIAEGAAHFDQAFCPK